MFKSLLYSIAIISPLLLLADQAKAILLGNLVDTSGTITVNLPGTGDFVFSSFSTGSTVETGLTQLRNFDVTGSLNGNNDPVLSFSGSTLDQIQDYFISYVLTAPANISFVNYDLLVKDGGTLGLDPCYDFGTCSTTTTLTSGSDSLGAVANGGSGTTSINKPGGGSVSSLSVSTKINIVDFNDSYTGFENTFDAEAVPAEAVPWDTNAAPLVGATLLFGGGVWWKRRRAAASQLDLTQPGPEQEPGQE